MPLSLAQKAAASRRQFAALELQHQVQRPPCRIPAPPEQRAFRAQRERKAP